MIICSLFVFVLSAIPLCLGTPVVFGYEDPSNNLIRNWDFESDISDQDWYMFRASGSLYDGGYTGQKSLRVRQRTDVAGSMYQKVYTDAANLKRNRNYYVSFFIKLLDNPPSDPYSTVRLLYSARLSAGGKQGGEVGRIPYCRKSGEWLQIGGDFKTPSQSFDSVEFHIRIIPKEIDYLVDTASLIELETHSNWKNYLAGEIDTHRKSQLTVKTTFPSGFNLANSKVKVALTRYEFGFGNAIKSLLFNRNQPVNVNYRNFILAHSNWITFENDMKWRMMEEVRGVLKYTAMDTALETLLDHNITVRGHTVDWEIPETNPSWVNALSGAALKSAIFERIDWLVKHFKGQVKEYDVCNEYMHGHYYEEETGVLDLYKRQMNRVRRWDPDVGVCLNDYEIVRTGTMTSANADLARSFLANDIPVTCIGIQSHLRVLPMDPEVIKKRVEIACSAGVPVTITEFSVHSPNVNVRAEGLDMAYRVYYSIPCVQAIINWGFSDQPGFSFIDDMYLTHGVGMTPNAAGQKMVNLIKNEWNTTKTFQPASRTFQETFLATHGNYKLMVTTGNQVVHERDFYVGKGPTTVNFSV